MVDAERKARLLELDRRHVWHPFTQMQAWPEDQPLIIAAAEGNELIDVDGRRYLDGVSSLWTTVHGHRKPEIDQAIVAQLSRVAHSTLLGLAHEPSIELAHRLAQLAPPGLARVFYSDSGSTAVEVALKMAFQYWRQRGRPEKRRFVALAEAYHGDTLGSVSVGGMELFHSVFRPLLFDVLRAPSPFPYRWPADQGEPLAGALRALEEILERHAGEVAALVIEPLVQGAAGMIVHPPGYLRGAAELCRRFEVLLIADEVATGFGRTGTVFAVEQEGVRPDLLCLAKGLTGGYLPLAATLATDAIYAAFLGPVADKRTFFHGHTYTGNPLACAAALANLELFSRERTLERAQETAALLARALAPLSTLPHVGEVRQKGLMIGVELVADRASRAEYPYGERMGHRVCLALRARGVLLRPLGNVVVLMPPLSLTADQAEHLAASLSAAIREVTEA